MYPNLYHLTSKISWLAKRGLIASARKLFDEMSQRDVITWNTMLSSYSQLGFHLEALSLFDHMRISSIKPDHFSFTSTLNACASINDLCYGEKLHASVIITGCQSSLPVTNSLIDMYGKCSVPCCSRKVFEETDEKNEVTWCSLLFAYVNAGHLDMGNDVFVMMPKRVTIAWNIMMMGCAKYGEIKLCVSFFREMQENLCLIDQWTLTSLMDACAESSQILYGYMIHAFVVKSGWSFAAEVKNSILSFYMNLDRQMEAIKEFESNGMLNQVSWNTIIDAYMKIGNSDKAIDVFHRATEKNVVTWTSMVTGFARNGKGEKALSFFVEMMRNCSCPDDFTFGAILHACSNLAVLNYGRMIHGCEIRRGYHSYVYVGNGLVNMYAKCGDIGASKRAFSEIMNKDLVSWNAMLFGFGMHGLANQALELYDYMLSSGGKPDKVTFIGLLTTCSHSGLINKGRMLFESMRLDFGLSYESDHISCMVDMLGRGGYLAEAEELANKFWDESFKGKMSSREALFSACCMHGDVEKGKNLGEELNMVEDGKKEMGFVMLSNMYCATGKWKEAEMMRKTMVDRGVKKMPGCSWIEVRNEVKAFVAGNSCNSCMDELCKVLCCLQLEMRNPCFLGS